MKFLCPSCKAKYQIADEKVAGRAVRMKCRKCGLEIRVTATDAVASSSVPPPPVEVAEAPSAVEGVASPPESVASPPESVASAPAPEPPAAKIPPERPKPAARAPMRSAPGLTPAAGAPRPGAPAPRPPPRTSGAQASRATGANRAVSPSAAKLNTPEPTQKPALVRSIPEPDKTPPEKPAQLRPLGERTAPLRSFGENKAGVSKNASSSLATATKPSVERPLIVGNAGAAPSPLKGSVDPTPEYQDEEEQTRIAADPGALAGAFSAAVTAHAPHAVSDPLSMPGDEWFVGINGVPVGPMRLSELRTKAATRAITSESLVWRDGFEEWRPLKSFPELVAVVEESLSAVRASALPGVFAPAQVSPQLAAISDPFAGTIPQPVGSTPGGAVTGAAVVTDDLALAGIRPRRTSVAAWFAMFVAVAFGIVIGFVFFSQKPAEVVRYVEVPAKGNDTVNATPAAVTQPDPNGNETGSKEEKAAGKGALTSTKPAAPKAEGENASGSKLTNGLRGLGPGLSGPKSGGGTGAPAVGGQLDAAALSAVVARSTPSVKRSCWQPAIDTREKDAPSSARVVVTIGVSAGGGVDNVSTSGDPRGYRGLASCIAARVRSWQFPPSGGATTLNVPFVFVAQ